MTGEELARRACRVARRDPDEEEARTQALEWIGEGQASLLAGDDPWDFLERSGYLDLIAGVDVYELEDIALALSIDPPGIDRVLELVPDSVGGQPLVPMYWQSQERFAGDTQYNNTPGYPASWAPVGPDKIRLWPMPTTGVRLGCLVRLVVAPTLAATAEPMIPAPFQSEVLVSYGAMRMWEQWAGADARLEAQRQGVRYETAVAKLRAAHGVARTPNAMFWEPSPDPVWFFPVAW